MTHDSKKFKAFLLFALMTTLFFTVMTVLYELFGARIVSAAFHGEKISFLHFHIMDHKQTYPFSFYLNKAGHIVYGSWIIALFAVVAFTILEHIGPKYFLIALLAAIDIALVLCSWVIGGPFDVSMDTSIPEVFEYGKEIVVGWIFFLFYRKERKLAYLGFSFLFFFLFMDDAFRYHELTGKFLAHVLILPGTVFGMPVEKKSVGEALSYIVPLAPLGALFGYIFLRARGEFDLFSRRFLSLLVALAFAVVVFDLVHSMFATNDVLGVMEESVEMVAMSLIVAYSAYRKESTAVTHEPVIFLKEAMSRPL